MGFLSGSDEIFRNQIVMLFIQLGEYTKTHWILSFNMMNFMLCSLYLKKKSGIQFRLTHCIHLPYFFNIFKFKTSLSLSLFLLQFFFITLTFFRHLGQLAYRMTHGLDPASFLMISFSLNIFWGRFLSS